MYYFFFFSFFKFLPYQFLSFNPFFYLFIKSRVLVVEFSGEGSPYFDYAVLSNLKIIYTPQNQINLQIQLRIEGD